MTPTHRLSHAVLYNISYIVFIRVLALNIYNNIPLNNISSIFIKNKVYNYTLFLAKMLVYYYSYFFHCLVIYKKHNIFYLRKKRLCNKITYRKKKFLFRKKKKIIRKKRRIKRRRNIYFFLKKNMFLKKKKIHKKYNFFFKQNHLHSPDLRGYFAKRRSYNWVNFYFGGLVSFIYKSKPLIFYGRFFKRLKKSENVLKKYRTNRFVFHLNIEHNINLLKYLSTVHFTNSVFVSGHTAITFFIPENKNNIFMLYKNILSTQSIFIDSLELPNAFFNLYKKRTHIHWN